MNVYESAGPAALAEFSVRFDKADQARVLRNAFMRTRETSLDPLRRHRSTGSRAGSARKLKYCSRTSSAS